MAENTVKLGLMPPLTGLVEMYGTEITRAAQIACAEVNENGGVLGRQLELVIEDDGSLPESAVAAATRLVDQHHCVAMIGNLLSNSRIAVAYRVAEPRRIPYLNFSFYEGSILSHYFFHFAALPNQQIDLMIPYMREQYGPRMFFAGNNYEWPRGSIDAAKRVLLQCGGQVVGEEYYPIGTQERDIEHLLDQVAASDADVFVPYFAGADQIHLLTRFTERGLKSRMAVVMGHYDEAMVSRLPPQVRADFYSSNTYFMSLDTPENRNYLERLSALPGVDGIWPNGNGILTNFGEGTYLCVKAFAQAANLAGSLDAEALVNALETICVRGPQGEVCMDPATHHAQVNTCLARCRADGSFAIIEHFDAIPPNLPERYRHLRISKQPGRDDIYLQSRMMAQISEAIFLVHATEGDIVYANPGAERMFGFSPGEMTGKPFALLLAPSGGSPHEVIAGIVEMLSRKGEWQGNMENITRDGRRLWCAASISVFTHPTYGEVWMIMNKDITERKLAEDALRASEERNQSFLFETMHEGYAHCQMLYRDGIAADFVYLKVNRKFEELTGLKNVAGNKVSSVIPGLRESNPELFEIYGRVASAGTSEKFETYVGPLKIWLSIAAYSPRKGQFVAVFDNITERKNIEQELIVANKLLTHEVAKRTADLTSLTAHIQNIAETERANLARELHDEMGSTLVGISMEVGRLKKKIADPALLRDVSTIKELILHATDTMRGIVNQLYPTVLDNYGYIAALEGLVGGYKKHSGIAVELDVPHEPISMEPSYALAAYRITQECLTNIAKHADADKVRIEAKVSGGMLDLLIQDNGIGLPDNLASGGHGILGMTERARFLGGTLDVSSAEGKGTAVHLRLPLASPTPGARKRVLVVDDHAIVRDAIRQLLESQTDDFVVAGEAADGQTAFDMATAEAWDIMLLDISLPRKSGIKVLEEIKAAKSTLPIIMLSSHAQDEYGDIALAKGAACYIEKGETDKLIEAMRRATLVS